MCTHWLEVGLSYGLFLYDFDLKKNFDKIEFATAVHRRNAAKVLKSGEKMMLMSDRSESNGDLLFAIIRNQKFVTLMLVKSYTEDLVKKLRENTKSVFIHPQISTVAVK